MTEKLCINCKYHDKRYDTSWCRRPRKQLTSLITGKVETEESFLLCETERTFVSVVDRCGEEGKYYEERKSFMSKVLQFLFESRYAVAAREDATDT